MAERKVIVKQVRSAIGRNPRTRKQLQALGLGRIGKQREFVATAAILGMVRQLEHLVTVEEIH